MKKYLALLIPLGFLFLIANFVNSPSEPKEANAWPAGLMMFNAVISETGSGGVGTLVDTNLVSRYYLDEAASGAPGGAIVDAAGSDDLAYTGSGVAYIEPSSNHRGLDYASATGTGRVQLVLNGTGILSDLNGATTYTVELAVNITAFQGGDNAGFMIALQKSGNFDPICLWGSNGYATIFFWSPQGQIDFDYDLEGAGFKIVHLVVDTTEGTDSNRVKLYVDGVQQSTSGTPSWPNQNDTITVATDDYITLGTDDNGGDGIDGIIHYAALYSGVLSQGDITNNVSVLTSSDDTP